MDFGWFQNILDKINEIGNFLCNTPVGVGCLIGACLVITLIIAALLERKTKRLFYNHPKDDEEETEDLDEDDEPIDLSNGILGEDLDDEPSKEKDSNSKQESK